MVYKALYRLWRPAFFKDVVGQEHVTRTLMTQIKTGRIAHAYLFAGSRGTGKTSTAKIFAKAINCENPQDGDACGQCMPCLAYANDETLDIIEMDAASNNGVDAIRDLKETIVFPPTIGKYKVYIVDEVHMLSTGAFNALLKTLEEPPAHAVFILATTEIHKLPATVLSRCQRFDFRSIPLEDILRQLKKILNELGATCDENALRLIARSAEGGLRDAISLLDTCLSYCGNHITYEDVVQIIGTADKDFLFACTDEIIAADAAALLRAVDRLVNEGSDLGVFMRDLMSHLRDCLVSGIIKDDSVLSDYTDEMKERLKAQAKKANPERLMRAIEILSSTESQLKLHTRPRILLETALVRICTPQVEDDNLSLRDRIAMLESRLEGMMQGQIQLQPQAAPIEAKKPKEAAPKAQPKVTKPAAAVDPVSGELWEALLARVKKSSMMVYSILKDALGGSRNGNVFTIYIDETTPAKQAFLTGKKDLLQKELEGLTGEKLGVLCELKATTPKSSGTDDIIAQTIDLFGEDNVTIK